MKIADIMTRTVATVTLDDSLADVKEIFDNAKFHHLLVTEDGKLIGVVSDRDLLKAVSPNLDTSRYTYHDVATLRKRVHQIVTRKPVTLGPEANVTEAAEIFSVHRFSCIPIVDADGRPVGIVSWRDIMKHLKAIARDYIHNESAFACN